MKLRLLNFYNKLTLIIKTNKIILQTNQFYVI